MKRRIVILLTALTVMSTLGACGSTTPAPAPTSTEFEYQMDEAKVTQATPAPKVVEKHESVYEKYAKDYKTEAYVEKEEPKKEEPAPEPAPVVEAPAPESAPVPVPEPVVVPEPAPEPAPVVEAPAPAPVVEMPVAPASDFQFGPYCLNTETNIVHCKQCGSLSRVKKHSNNFAAELVKYIPCASVDGHELCGNCFK